jgi:hypothetical protein
VSEDRHLVDVGGAVGGLTAFLERYPDLRATVLDRPDVRPGAEELLRGAGVRVRVELVAGDFFEPVPAES